MTMRGRSQVTSKGTVTIPVEIRRELGIEEGDVLVFEREGDHIVLSRSRSVVEETAGVFAAYARGTDYSDADWDRMIGDAIAEDYLRELEESKREPRDDDDDGLAE